MTILKRHERHLHIDAFGTRLPTKRRLLELDLNRAVIH